MRSIASMAGHESGRRTSSLIRSSSGLRDDSRFTWWEISNVQVIMTDGEEEFKSSRESPTGSFSSSSHIAAIFLIRKILFGVDDMSESCRGCLDCFTSLNQNCLDPSFCGGAFSIAHPALVCCKVAAVSFRGAACPHSPNKYLG